MSNDFMKLVFGYLFLWGGPIGIIWLLFIRVRDIIVSYKKGYIRVNGKIIDYVNSNDERYINHEIKRMQEKNPSGYKRMLKLAEFAEKVESSSDEAVEEQDACFVPLIEYEVAGKKYHIFYTVAAAEGKVGKIKKLKYDPNNPEDAIFINDNSYLFLIIILLVLMGVGYILINY